VRAIRLGLGYMLSVECFEIGIECVLGFVRAGAPLGKRLVIFQTLNLSLSDVSPVCLGFLINRLVLCDSG
jgi:hypothetical protein